MRAFEWFLAWRFVLDRRGGFTSLISILSFLGIVIGVATLIVVTSVMNGFRVELFKKILGFSGHGQVETSSGLSNYDEVAQKLRALEGVTRATPSIDTQGLISANQRSLGVSIRGLSSEDLAESAFLTRSLLAIGGELSEFQGQVGVMIGDSLSRTLQVGVGDRVMLLSPQGQYSPFGFLPIVASYRVFGIFDTGQFQYDSMFVLMPLDQAQIMAKLEDQVNVIQLEMTNPDQAAEVIARVNTVLPENANAVSWQQSHATLYKALETERNVMILILTLIILVAALNIISGQVMLVKDKSKIIAVLNAMGATRATILRIFFLSGSLIGVSGTAVGLFLGLVLAKNVDYIRIWLKQFADIRVFQEEIYFLSHLPSQTKNAEVVIIVVAALVISMLAALYPAWRASRLDPVVLLRNQ